MLVMNIDKVIKNIVSKINGKKFVDFFQIYITESTFDSKKERIDSVDIYILAKVCNAYYEISTTFSGDYEIDYIVEQLFTYSTEKNIFKVDDLRNSKEYKVFELPRKTNYGYDEQIKFDIVSENIRCYYFNSYNKSLYNEVKRYNLIKVGETRKLFCRNSIEEILFDYQVEKKIADSANDFNSSYSILAPRVVHQLLTEIFSKMILLQDVELLKKYINSLNVSFKFGNFPQSNASLMKDAFDLYGNLYSNFILIENNNIKLMSMEDYRYELSGSTVKSNLKFPVFEVEKNIDNLNTYRYYYDFIGKVNFYQDYISGTLYGTSQNLKLDIRITTLLSKILSSYGNLTNVKHIYIGANPYIVLKGI